MTLVLENLGQFFLVAIAAMFVQNAVFARGFGASRLIKLVSDSPADSMIFCILLAFVQVISAPMGYYVNQFLEQPQFWYRDYIRPLGLVICAVIAFTIVLIAIVIIHPAYAKELLAVLPMASFNCTIMGPMLIAPTYKYTFTQNVGFALGSSLGYVFAVIIVTEGQRKMQGRRVPGIFRGLPINLIYIGILALAIYGLTGHRLAV